MTNESYANRYWNDPVLWLKECILWPAKAFPASYQEELLSKLPFEKRVSTRGPHGLGKSAMMSWAVLWFATTRDAAGVDWKVLTLASAWRQLEKFLWPEIHKWARRLDWTKLGRTPFTDRELLQLSIKLNFGEAFAISSDNPAMIEGAHADHIFYVFDESKIIPDPVWDSAEGAFSAGEETFWFSASTPGDPQGRFYQIQNRSRGFDDWWVRPVKVEEAIAAGRISREWVEQRKKQWGENSAVFLNRVLGEFAGSTTDGVIPLAWVEEAISRWYDLHSIGSEWKEPLPEATSLGVDVGRGGDPSTVAIRHGYVISEIAKAESRDTMELVGNVARILRAFKNAIVAVVDVIGLGAGVVDRLRELKFPVVAFNAAEKTAFTDISGGFLFSDSRSAAWWHMRELLDPSSGYNVALPPDEDDILLGDLSAPTWKLLSGGQIKVESKDTLRQRLGRSTDYADSVIQAFWSDAMDSLGASWDDIQGLGHVEDYVNRWA